MNNIEIYYAILHGVQCGLYTEEQAVELLKAKGLERNIKMFYKEVRKERRKLYLETAIFCLFGVLIVLLYWILF